MRDLSIIPIASPRSKVVKKSEEIILRQEEKRNLQKPVTPSDIQKALEDEGVGIHTFAQNAKVLATATEYREEPRLIQATDELGEPMFEDQIINGELKKVPIMVPVYDDKGKIQTVLKEVPNVKAREKFLDIYVKTQLAEPAKETNITVGLNPDKINRAKEINSQISPDTKKQLLQELDADWEEL